MGRKLAELGERYPLAGEQPLHPIRVSPAIASSKEQLAVHLASILLDRRRHIHDAPYLLLAPLGPDEHRHELGGVEPIRLRAAAAPVDLDARRVDDAIRDPATHQIPMQPEPVAAGFVAAAHGRGGRQAEVRLRSRDLGLERLQCSRAYLAAQRRLIHSGGHRQHPLGVAEFEGEI